ncbi:hypothetical protein [Telmatospirillum sp.]|uniref:hypothetical protein n=1 Tax=Telmatospirillum sp. TaxID=2079197 RepID=UPI00284FC302|nr:hypothetical protein [Telmatospirillum sp.]MDR3441241.1 hypothetical protein [Telmatospirillum sp.]
MVRAGTLGAIWLACLIFSSTCCATSLKEVRIGLRVVDFLAVPLSPHSRLAILYDSRNKDSQDDAKAILSWVIAERNGVKTSVVPVLVDVHSLDTALEFQIGFLAAGTEASYAAVHDFARTHGVLTISSDLSCVRAAKCSVGVLGAPRVEVSVNRQVLEASGIVFSEAFRMMVTEY